jgi:hypothetical protein
MVPCLRYERDGRARKTVRAQQLWFAVLESQIEVLGGMQRLLA